jgi:hypothetical protein
MDADNPSNEDVSIDLLEESQRDNVSVDLLEDSQPDPPRQSNPYARVAPIINPYARIGVVVNAPPPAVDDPPPSPLFSAVENSAMLPSKDDCCYDENIDGELPRVRLYGGGEESFNLGSESNDDKSNDDNNDDGNYNNNDDVYNNYEEIMSTDDDDYHESNDDARDGTEGTVVPGTAYDIISSAARRAALANSVGTSTIDGIDPDEERWIRQCMLVDWGILSPHEWQIRAIHNVAFTRDQLIYLVAKTGSGKSAVPMTVGSLQMGVTLTMVPLVGLGSDQVKSAREPKPALRDTIWMKIVVRMEIS